MTTAERALLATLGLAFVAIWIVPPLADALGWPVAIGLTLAGIAGLLLYEKRKA